MKANSRRISTNQDGVHPKLEATVSKHLTNPYQRPIAAEQLRIFQTLEARVREFAHPIILDSCCGNGESSAVIAQSYSDRLVIGVDKSAARLRPKLESRLVPNLILLRADCIDFWRLAAAAKWEVERHFIYYPNPWPKAHHLQRRWHGHPVFPSLIALGGALEIRSNWRTYLEEFSLALALSGQTPSAIELIEATAPISAFEKKYALSGQNLYQLNATVGG